VVSATDATAPAEPIGRATTGGAPPKVAFDGLRVRYREQVVIENLTLEVMANEILGIIGPAGSGKTSLLRTLNRTIELVPGAKVTGAVRLDGEDIFRMRDVSSLRRRVGMVAPLPVGLPMSIYDNVAFAPRMAGVRDKSLLDEKVRLCLEQAALWDEVKDRLDDLGTRLSGGQQQRLTIARALSHDPEVLCLDEFSIAIDPVTTMRIEDVLKELKQQMSILLVTNLVQQARRLADRTAFMLMGELVEVGPTKTIFGRKPADRRTYEYTHGLFG
jgi:phosphate transport system ATP-binding protein